MSARLLGIAFACDMATPCRKLVLLKLIDACEDDGTRIFPAVSTIARAAQCSTRQVQRELASMVEAGLLSIVREGGRGPRNTREYALDLPMLRRVEARGEGGWKDELAAAPVNAETPAKGDTVSPLTDPAKGDTGGTLRVTPETSKGDSACHPTPQEPSNNPSRERGAQSREANGEEEKKDDPKRFEERVKKLADNDDWNHLQGSSTAWTVREFGKLDDAERAEAETHAAAYRAFCRRSKGVKVVALGLYFRERKWRDLPATAREPDADDGLTVVKSGGAVFAVVRMVELLKGPCALPPMRPLVERMISEGRLDAEAENRNRRARFGFPKVNRMHEAVAAGANWCLRDGDERFAEARHLAEPLEVGSETCKSWQAEHEARGWPWPDLGTRKYFYFPVGGPAGLPEFEAAIEDLVEGENVLEQAGV